MYCYITEFKFPDSKLCQIYWYPTTVGSAASANPSYYTVFSDSSEAQTIDAKLKESGISSAVEYFLKGEQHIIIAPLTLLRTTFTNLEPSREAAPDNHNEICCYIKSIEEHGRHRVSMELDHSADLEVAEMPESPTPSKKRRRIRPKESYVNNEVRENIERIINENRWTELNEMLDSRQIKKLSERQYVLERALLAWRKSDKNFELIKFIQKFFLDTQVYCNRVATRLINEADDISAKYARFFIQFVNFGCETGELNTSARLKILTDPYVLYWLEHVVVERESAPPHPRLISLG